LQPSFEKKQEMEKKKREAEAAAKAALFWDPLKLLEDAQREMVVVPAPENKKAVLAGILKAALASGAVV